jgi:3-hydroxybutyryl-CoA dehydrogenase
VTTIGIVGAGTMGTGIAQVALEAGETVVLHDVDGRALGRARDRVRSGLLRWATRSGSSDQHADVLVAECLDRLRTTDALREVAEGSSLVIEAALEELGIKRSIFRVLDASAPVDAVLATNTSALSVTAISEAAIHRERVLGLHFFNPVPRMSLVEVAVTEATAPAVVGSAEARMATWGKTTVRCADSPGFIVNRVNRPFTIEALRMLEAGEASVVEIDAAMRDRGYPMGPFELMDLVGLDVNLAAARGVWEALGRPDRLRPSPIQEQLVAAGRLGRKAGRGFYRHDGDRRGPVEADFAGAEGQPRRADIAGRIEQAVAAEARRAAGEGIATMDAIELALRLGTGRPATTGSPMS